MLQRLRQLWVKEWTKFWGWLKVAAGSLMVSFHWLVGLFQDSNVKTELDKLNVPWIGISLAVIGFITLASVAHPTQETNA